VLLPSCLPYEKSDDRVLAQGTCTPSVRALVRRRPDHCSQRRMAHSVPLSRFTSSARRG
jgi:hypothetical protein